MSSLFYQLKTQVHYKSATFLNKKQFKLKALYLQCNQYLQFLQQLNYGIRQYIQKFRSKGVIYNHKARNFYSEEFLYILMISKKGGIPLLYFSYQKPLRIQQIGFQWFVYNKYPEFYKDNLVWIYLCSFEHLSLLYSTFELSSFICIYILIKILNTRNRSNSEITPHLQRTTNIKY
ncbi:unnamed protein product [Paramecium primaurelia]|uniref:Uncharacterized protein n=1 Tax=Paramecium primaurelia TaxID=5886 RepID=A0A8S1PC04_PARPR|nr:unnamed protein product [Paramecium primaurelia]